jgi:ribosomal protein S12 methylthiotransferase accessory factor
VGFLGFPSFHVYIPGMSEAMRLDCEQLKLRIRDIPKASKTFYNIDHADTDDILHLINTIEALVDEPYFPEEMILKTIHNLSLNGNVILNNLDPENVLAILYYKIKDYQSAYHVLRKYLKKKLTPEQFYHPPAYAVDHYCLLKFFEYMVEGHDLDLSRRKVDAEYESKTVDQIWSVLNSPSQLREYLGIPKCDACKDCHYQELCAFEDLNTLSHKLQERINAYPINQHRIKEYID